MSNELQFWASSSFFIIYNYLSAAVLSSLAAVSCKSTALICLSQEPYSNSSITLQLMHKIINSRLQIPLHLSCTDTLYRPSVNDGIALQVKQCSLSYVTILLSLVCLLYGLSGIRRHKIVHIIATCLSHTMQMAARVIVLICFCKSGNSC